MKGYIMSELLGQVILIVLNVVLGAGLTLMFLFLKKTMAHYDTEISDLKSKVAHIESEVYDMKENYLDRFADVKDHVTKEVACINNVIGDIREAQVRQVTLCETIQKLKKG